MKSRDYNRNPLSLKIQRQGSFLSKADTRIPLYCLCQFINFLITARTGR